MPEFIAHHGGEAQCKAALWKRRGLGTLRDWARQNCVPGCTVYSDGLACLNFVTVAG